MSADCSTEQLRSTTEVPKTASSSLRPFRLWKGRWSTPVSVGPFRVAHLAGRTTNQPDSRIPSAFITADFEDLANEARDMGSVLVGRMNSFRRSMEQWRQRPGIPGVYLVRGKPRSTLLVPGSGQRLVTTLPRV